MANATQSTTSLANVEVFCRTVELGSFTAAARSLGVTPQAASRAVTRLETGLGVGLLRRSTRDVRPTEAGARYHARCREALGLLDLAAESAGASGATAIVRISVPSTIGHARVLPALAELAQRAPTLRFEIAVSNHNVDFVRDGYDLAVRMGEIDRASFVARKLGTYALAMFASPQYLRRTGKPKRFEDLAEHQTIGFLRPSTGRVLPWELVDGRTWIPGGPWKCSDDFLGCITLARAGAGIVQAYRFLVENEVRSGALVEVLPELAGAARKFSLVYPRQGTAGPRPAVRMVIDHLCSALRDPATTR